MTVYYPCYPPTQTLFYLRCPALWRLSKTWRQRAGWTPNALAGIAIHRAMAVSLLRTHDPLDAARGCLEQGWVQGTEHEIEATWALIKRGLNKALKTDLLEGGELLGVEECLDHQPCPAPVPGECSITDLVHRTREGHLCVTDHKSKLSLDERYIQKERRLVDHSWQLMDYAWRAGNLMGGSVQLVRQHLIVCSPKAQSYLDEKPVTQLAMARWLESAKVVWDRMYEDELAVRPPMNWTSCEDYGGCPFYDVHHSPHLFPDDAAMERVFERRSE